MKNSAPMLLALVLLVVLTSVANGQLELRQDSNSFKQVPLGDKTGVTAEINLTRQLFIEGYYHDFTDGKLGAILLVDMATDDGLVKLQYPAMVMLPGDGRNSPFQFPIYGPWFYQGDRDLKVTLTMVLLKKERAQELRNKFQSILGGVTNLLTVIPGVSSALPVINTGAGITNKAWDIFDLFASKDEKVPLGSFSITRVPLKDIKSETDKKELLDGKAIGTFQRWLVLTSSKSEPLYRNIQYSVTNQGAEPRPIVPANKDARVLLLRVKQTAPTASMKALGDRLAAFLGAQKTRLTNANVDLKNPFSGENLAAETHIQRIFNGLVAFTSEARNKAGMTNREAVLWMMGELLNGQNSGDSDASYVKLKTADEARVTAALNRMFKYQKSTEGPSIESNDGTQGFSKILVWYNWITKRDKADSISWDPASEVAPFGTVSGGYTLKRAASYLPATSTDTANPPNYNQMGEQIDALRQGLLTIFRPTSGEPFMLFEQQAVADWMRQSFSNLGIDIPGSFKSSDEVAEFAAKLDKVLSNKKVVIYDASQKSIAFQDIVPYARRLFGKEVAQIGPSTTTDQTAKLRELVNVYIIPARKRMSADEQAELDDSIADKLAQLLCENFLRDAGHCFSQRREVFRRFRQPVDDDQLPLAADRCERRG